MRFLAEVQIFIFHKVLFRWSGAPGRTVREGCQTPCQLNDARAMSK